MRNGVSIKSEHLNSVLLFGVVKTLSNKVLIIDNENSLEEAFYVYLYIIELTIHISNNRNEPSYSNS